MEFFNRKFSVVEYSSVAKIHESASFPLECFVVYGMQYVTADHWAYVHIHVFILLFTYTADFTVLKARYHTILHLMPDEYELTVGKLQNCIGVDQICAILSSSNSTSANKIILDYLIERINYKEELLDLCHQLEIITTSHDMNIVINEIRLG